ncbi:MAG: cation:proton antiporter [Nanoarchaeota archaeon]
MLPFIQEFSILFIIVVVLSFFTKLVRQPIILGYVIAGLLFSFVIPESSSTAGQIITLAELGVTFLLFLMGMEFDLRNLKYLRNDILITSIIQSAVFFSIAFLAAFLFKFNLVECTYIAIIFMFSSTLLVAKWIDDKKEMSSLYGKLVLGTLMVQDLLAIIALTLINVVKEESLAGVALVPVGGIALFVISVVFAKYFLNYLFKFAVKYPELLFMFGLGICFFFVEISPLLGYSAAIGAFIAGVTIANTIYKTDVHSRLRPLILFFNMLFFVGLGFQIKLNLHSRIFLFTAVLCGLSLVVKPAVVYVTLKLKGYDMKTSVVSGLNLAQMSEFSIIIVAAGMLSGFIPEEISTISVISVVVTMLVSSYLIKYDAAIFRLMEKYLRPLDKLFPAKKEIREEQKKIEEYDVIFLGYHDLGKELLSKLEAIGRKVLVIENDPATIELLKKEGIHYNYNSLANPYFFKEFNFKNVDLLVSSLMDLEDNRMLIKNLKENNPQSKVIVTAKSVKDSLDLYDHGADYVIYPHYINNQLVSVLMEDYTTDINKVIAKKVSDITKLKEMDERIKSFNTAVDIDQFLKVISSRQLLKEKLKSQTEVLKSKTGIFKSKTEIFKSKTEALRKKSSINIQKLIDSIK